MAKHFLQSDDEESQKNGERSLLAKDAANSALQAWKDRTIEQMENTITTRRSSQVMSKRAPTVARRSKFVTDMKFHPGGSFTNLDNILHEVRKVRRNKYLDVLDEEMQKEHID
jgi:hypothetical protein